VVVAVIAVWVVKPVAHHVIDMVAVGDRLMPTLRAVLMGRTVPRGRVCVLRRVLAVDINGMLVDMALVRMMQMALMQIVGVVTMAHSDMPAARPVGVRVILVFLTGHGSHDTAQCQRPHSGPRRFAGQKANVRFAPGRLPAPGKLHAAAAWLNAGD
jgi:hypothetical protein